MSDVRTCEQVGGYGEGRHVCGQGTPLRRQGPVHAPAGQQQAPELGEGTPRGGQGAGQVAGGQREGGQLRHSGEEAGHGPGVGGACRGRPRWGGSGMHWV